MEKSDRVIAPFTPASIHEQIVRHIGLSILRNELVPGQALPGELELCAQLAVSRPILREAMKVLADKGLVESRRKTGTCVRPREAWNLLDPDVLAWQCEAVPDETFLRNMGEIRLGIEPLAARLAALRATPEQLTALEIWYRRMQRALDENEAFISADLQFHNTILAAAHNELLQQMSSTINAALHASRVITTQLPGSSEASMPLHQAVLEAIQNRNPAAAQKAMEELVVSATGDVEQVLHRQRVERKEA